MAEERGIVSDGDVSFGQEDQSRHCVSLSPENYADVLDYDENVEGDSEDDHTHKSRRAQRVGKEDGEVLSGEEGEIRENTPPSRNPSKRRSSTSGRTIRESLHSKNEKTSSSSNQRDKGQNICRHFLQGRCSWGDECRFVHETPSSTEDSSPHKRHSRSPVEYSLRSFRPPHSYRGLPPSLDHTHTRLPHPHSIMDFATFSHGRHSRSSLDMIHPHYHHPPPPPAYYRNIPWPSPHHTFPTGGSHPDMIGGIEKIEESQGWHRLRTIPSGWDSDEEEVKKATPPRDSNDLRSKLKKKHQSSNTSSDSESSKDSIKKKKKQKKKRKQQKCDDDRTRGEEWIDPWDRQYLGKTTKRGSSDSDSSNNDRDKRKTKSHSKRKEKEHPSPQKPSHKSSSAHKSPSLLHREKILKELENVTQKLERKKSSHH